MRHVISLLVHLPRLNYVLFDLIAIPPSPTSLRPIQSPSIVPVQSMAKLSYTGMYVSPSFVSRFFHCFLTYSNDGLNPPGSSLLLPIRVDLHPSLASVHQPLSPSLRPLSPYNLSTEDHAYNANARRCQSIGHRASNRGESGIDVVSSAGTTVFYRDKWVRSKPALNGNKSTPQVSQSGLKVERSSDVEHLGNWVSLTRTE